MKSRCAFLLFLLPCFYLQSASLTLINDSTFPLYANIYNAAGDKETSITMSPGQSYIWSQDLSPFKKQYDTPTTPYTVRWVCATRQPYDYSVGKKKPKQKYVSEYGVWNNVPLGATVNAQGSTNGTMTCTVRKEPPSPKSSATARAKKRKYKNEGFNNWSNDGGQTWSNDAGPGWEDEEEPIRKNAPGWRQEDTPK